MDQVVQISPRDRLVQAARAAAAVNDASAPLIQAMLDRCDIEQQRDDRVEQMLETAEKIAAGAIAARAAGELPRSVDRLVWQRWWKLSAWFALAAVGLLLAGLGLGYLLRGAAPEASCEPQRGGVVCYYWLKAPTER